MTNAPARGVRVDEQKGMLVGSTGKKKDGGGNPGASVEKARAALWDENPLVASIGWMRRMYYTNGPRTVVSCSVVLLVSSATAVASDLLLPSGRWWNWLRSVPTVAGGAALCVLCYLAAMFAGEYLRGSREGWEPVKSLFSLRQRLALVCVPAAVGAVLLYAVTDTVFYTLTSIGLFCFVLLATVFCYPTPREWEREELGLADARDARLRLRVVEGARAARSPFAALRGRRGGKTDDTEDDEAEDAED